MAEVDRTLYGDEHVRRYEETDGEEGYHWNGTQTLILTTTGRNTGKNRKHALIFGQDGDDVVVVASKGGAPDHPHWYQNLDADEEVKVQVKGDRYDAIARSASPEEKARLWPVMLQEWPPYAEYQEKTERDIPVVVISRA